MRQYFESQVDPKFNITLQQIVEMNGNRLSKERANRPNLISIDRVGRQKVYFIVENNPITLIDGSASVQMELVAIWDDEIDTLSNKYLFVRMQQNMPILKALVNEPTAEV